MNTRITDSKLFKRLKDRKYRDRFISGEIKRLIPFQLRALRASRKWTQAQLGNEASMPQTVISRIENGNAASLSIKTLLKLASAFDVALVVRFEPIDNLIHWVDTMSPETISPRASSEILDDTESDSSLIGQRIEQDAKDDTVLRQLSGLKAMGSTKQKAGRDIQLLSKVIGG